jgi:hypothetical protein
MGRWHRRHRTPRYHCFSALGHEETFTKLIPPGFPQFANANSVVDLRSSLTIEARTVTIFSEHKANTHPQEPHSVRILLGSIRPPRGRQSRNESQEMDTTTIALASHNSNTIHESDANVALVLGPYGSASILLDHAVFCGRPFVLR